MTNEEEYYSRFSKEELEKAKELAQKYFPDSENICARGNVEICDTKKASRNYYKKIIEHYGVRNQLKKLSEEVYELQEAVIDLQDFTTCGNADTQLNQNVIEEIADVFVILRQLVMQFDIAENDIEDMADYKINRTLERIKKEE